MINKIEEIKQILDDRGFDIEEEYYYCGIFKVLATSKSVQLELETYDFNKFIKFSFYPRFDSTVKDKAREYAMNVAKDVCESNGMSVEYLDKYLKVYNKTYSLMVELCV